MATAAREDVPFSHRNSITTECSGFADPETVRVRASKVMEKQKYIKTRTWKIMGANIAITSNP